MTKKMYRPGWRSAISRGRPTHKSGRVASRLKIILPLAIVLVLVSIFLWPKITNLITVKKQPKTIERILKENPLLENKVIHPKLDSIDKNGRPFLIEAKYAIHLNDDKTEFTEPSGHIILDDGSTMSFVGDKGFYYKSTEMLEIMDHVNVKTDKGYDLKTEYMKLFPKENIGEGDKPVYGTGPSGETIQAEGFKITDKGDIIEFLGKTQISLPGSK
jgi:lipopolysaccharide export system protein LptC